MTLERQKSQNLGPGFFWQALECEIYRISYVAGAAPILPTTIALSDSSTERRLESWKEGVEEFRSVVLSAIVQNTTMHINKRIGG